MSYVKRRGERRYRHLSMGDAATTPDPGTTLSQDTYDVAVQQLAAQQNLVAFLKGAEDRARFQKWVQIAATLSIPLAAAIWRAILGRRRAKMSV